MNLSSSVVAFRWVCCFCSCCYVPRTGS